MGTLYDVARQVTDEVCGDGTYAKLNEHHPDPGVQAAIAKWRGDAGVDSSSTDPERPLE